MGFFRHHIFCCANRREPGHARGCCAEKNAEELRDYMKARVKELGLKKTRVNAAGCLDRCELGPTMVIYPEGVWYSCRNKADVDEVIAEHLQKGKVVERLRIKSGENYPRG
ncbi:MAG: (2Fe-2S) ferredoxin domain-containing protein [Pseudomonadota bacterium]|nr:(2Fe-2S) ferredoxin domain-containing protein [Pseudomonadota bacterium]MDE3037732.1 (2Fe-2S) ferredoxin domain-containing protein [Pseudomonadota bacterium]